MMGRRSLRLAMRAAAIAAAGGFAFASCAAGVLVSAANPRAIPSITDFPTATAVLAPEFSISPTTLDLGKVLVGQKAQGYVVLTNTGTTAEQFDLRGGLPTSDLYEFDVSRYCAVTNFTHGSDCALFYIFHADTIGRVDATSTISIGYLGAQQRFKLTVHLTACAVPDSGICPPTPASTPTATTKPTNRGGTRTVAAGQPTGGGSSPLAGEPPSTTPLGTAAASTAPAGSGPGLVAMMLGSAGAAFAGAVLAGLLFWRGRQIWARLTSGRRSGP